MAMPGQGMRDFPASQKTETLEQIKRDPIFIASHWKDPNVFFHADGSEKVGDIEARIVDVNAAGDCHPLVCRSAERAHFERDLSHSQPGRQPAQGETDMDNWKPVNGLTLPLLRHNKQNGQDTARQNTSTLEFNPDGRSEVVREAGGKPAPKVAAQRGSFSAALPNFAGECCPSSPELQRSRLGLQ